MVYIIHNCDCRTCNGGNPAPPGVIGGSICNCRCHFSGHPIDTEEHRAWEREQSRKYLVNVLGSEEAADNVMKSADKLGEAVKEYFEKELDRVPTDKCPECKVEGLRGIGDRMTCPECLYQWIDMEEEDEG